MMDGIRGRVDFLYDLCRWQMGGRMEIIMNASAVNELIEALSSGKKIHTLCNILSKYIGNPVAVALTSETLIGYSSDFTNDFISEFTSSSLYMSEDELFDMRSSFQKFLKGGKPHIQAWPYLRHKQMNCGCLYKGSLVATLIIPLANSFDDIDLELVETTARIIAVWVADNGYITNASAKEIQNFLHGLFSGDISDNSQRKNLMYMEFANTKAYKMIWIAPICEDNADFEYKLAVLCKRAKLWWHISYENGFIVLMDASADEYLPELEQLLEKNEMVACISDEFNDIMETKMHYESVHFILSLRSKLGIESCLIDEDDYKQIYASAYARKNLPSYIFQNKKLEEMIEYDANHATRYLDTLRLFFLCNRDFDRIANEMNVHKNTVFYRINRMKELFDIDLNDNVQAFSLFNALNANDHII